jgi:hypothetical protein
VIGPRGVTVVSSHFYRPYYTFRPYYNLGFGLWAGYPVTYPYYAYPYYGYPYYDDYYSYGYPYPAYPPYGGYPADPSYGNAPYNNAPNGSMNVQPGNNNSGGLSFDISPSTAEVYVDGQYQGTAGNFTASSEPLTLSPGKHHVEVRAPGYQVMSFDADVVAGQVIPYQGNMQPANRM